MREEIIIYTDGSCSPNPGSGGYAALLLREGLEPEVIQGAERESTNNRMELTAPIKALQSLKDGIQVEIRTDSTYVRDGVTQWAAKWQQRDWQTMDGQDVKNKDLWQQLLKETKRLNVSWLWVKGHSDDQYNQLVDKLAVEAREVAPVPVLSEKAVNIFLGVTCKHSTKTGAWAAVLVYRQHHKILGDNKTDVTANILYLEALIQALSALKREIPVVVFTSSGYLKEGATAWLPGWRRRNWMTRDDQEVVNKSYWQKLDDLQNRYMVEYQLVDKSQMPCYSQEAKELAREFEQA